MEKKALMLTTWERVTLYRILGEARGNVEVMEKCFELRSLLKLDEAELTSVNSTYGVGGMQFKGNPQEFESVLDKEWAVEIPDDSSYSFMLNSGIRYDGWLGEDAARSIALVHKLKKLKEQGAQ